MVFLVLAGVSTGLKLWREERSRGMGIAIDGDSLRLDGVEIRLMGIDAPEFDQPCFREGRPWRCGPAARAHLARALAQGEANCVSNQRDRYGRALARCSVNGVEINAAMVREGMAFAYGDAYRREQAEARDARRGLWAGPPAESPQEWRRAHARGVPDMATTTPADDGGTAPAPPLPPPRPRL